MSRRRRVAGGGELISLRRCRRGEGLRTSEGGVIDEFVLHTMLREGLTEGGGQAGEERAESEVVTGYAQQTDAGQLTRSLILEPRATVNVKPNLQIIADDVKCSHGASICDLEEDQLFYLQARGIDLQTARRALILSFGAEVIERFPSTVLQKKVELHVKKLLDPKIASGAENLV